MMVLKYLCFCHSKQHRMSSKTKRPYPTVIEELCHQFSLADLMKATNNFDQNRLIGERDFGKVYEGCLQLDSTVSTTVAVKLMSKYEMGEFHREIELLCQLRHPNLISLIGFCIHKNNKFIVYEYMSNGSLADCLFNVDREPLSWKTRLEICIGAARGLHYLHSGAKRTIFHRDIKPSNILLDNNMVPKLYDFGISLQGPLFTSKPKLIKGKPVAGTIGYMAPEYAINGTLTDKCDVFSFGMVLLHVVRAKPINTILKEILDDCEEINGFVSYIMTRLRAEDIDSALKGKIAPECYAMYIDIIDKCLKEEPDERPIMGEVEMELEHVLALQQEADATDAI